MASYFCTVYINPGIEEGVGDHAFLIIGYIHVFNLMYILFLQNITGPRRSCAAQRKDPDPR
jgi:hypothetical protein